MEPETESISHERLFEAAEALVTLVSEASDSGRVWISMNAETSRNLRGLSSREIDEGIHFLARLGLIEIIA